MELKRFRLLWDKDEEQRWLNEMCHNGWALKKFFAGLYTFVPCRPGEYIYQVDLLPGQGFTPSDPTGYDEFMADMGVDVVQHWGRWAILRKSAAEGPFEIYTDLDSQISLYTRIRSMFVFGLGIELCCSAGIWPNLHRGGIFFTLAALLYAAILVAFVRAIVTCSRKIKNLEETK